MGSLMDDAMRMNADAMVDSRSAKAPGAAPSLPRETSNPSAATGQKAATLPEEMVRYAKGIVELVQRVQRGDMLVSTCGNCAKTYSLAEFLLLEGVGWAGNRSPKFWQGINGDVYEMRNCACGSSLSRLVPRG